MCGNYFRILRVVFNAVILNDQGTLSAFRGKSYKKVHAVFWDIFMEPLFDIFTYRELGNKSNVATVAAVKFGANNKRVQVFFSERSENRFITYKIIVRAFLQPGIMFERRKNINGATR